MKFIYTLGIITLFSLNGFGQDAKDCYTHYYEVFQERGAYKVTDGLHAQVIVTIRNTTEINCFMGKANVKNGVVENIQLMLEDDTYEKLNVKFKNDYPITIHNGVSRAQITVDDEIINVMFIKKIKPKKKNYKKAPLISIDEL